jgi:thioredoxin 1
MASTKIITATNLNFETEVLKSDKPVLVDFWAAWCGPCRMVAPVLEQLASEYEGKVLIAKVNVDEQIELASRYGIRSIPTVILFKNGQIASFNDRGSVTQEKHIGVRSKEEYAAAMNRHL